MWTPRLWLLSTGERHASGSTPATSQAPARSGRSVRMTELHLSDEVLDAIASAVAAKLTSGVSGSSSSRWMTAAEAADYLRCSTARVRRLTGSGELPSHRDGVRVLINGRARPLRPQRRGVQRTLRSAAARTLPTRVSDSSEGRVCIETSNLHFIPRLLVLWGPARGILSLQRSTCPHFAPRIRPQRPITTPSGGRP
jgi:excisionase family DNA binding protein